MSHSISFLGRKMADFKTQQITLKSLGTNIPTEKAEIILLYFSSISLIHRCATELYCILGGKGGTAILRVIFLELCRRVKSPIS